MSRKTKEIRLFNTNLECRELENGKMIIEGYAVVFDSPATHYNYTEIIDRNAFNGADIKDVILKYNHDDSHLLLARTRNKSLTLTIDDIGLFIRAELIDTTSNIDIYKAVKAGLLDKMSFAFTVEREENDWENDTRKILQFDKIFDVSIVDVPFYEQTEVYARSVQDSEDRFFEEKRKAEELGLEKEKMKLMIECI